METVSYEFFTTADGSPTLIAGSLEKMHSDEGALSETHFIYGRALDYLLENSLPSRIAVVGMGLGYIEMMIAARFAAGEIFLVSFEKDPFLRNIFLHWLAGGGAKDKYRDDFQRALDAVLAMTAARHGLEAAVLKDRLLKLWREGGWRVEGELTPEPRLSDGDNFSAILFDAFSRRATPELWETDFLEKFIDGAAGENCVFTTYACLGNLKRALKKRNFRLLESAGFGRKRESTFAVRRSPALS